MAIKSYIIDTPEQLRTLHALRPEGNQSMDNLARAWRAQCVLASAHYSNPMPTGFARVDFDTKARTAMVYKTIHGSVAAIGSLPYNKALAACRDFGLPLTYCQQDEINKAFGMEG